MENIHVDCLFIQYKVLSPHSNANVLFVIHFAKSVKFILHNITVSLFRWLHRASTVTFVWYGVMEMPDILGKTLRKYCQNSVVTFIGLATDPINLTFF